ncbi:hypothetical protein Tco_1388903, partial [Tanacetum coccineum]
MKLYPSECTFGIEEGKFLGYVVMVEGIKDDPEMVKAIIWGSTLEGPEHVQNLCLQLTNISRFIPKLAELIFPFREIQRNISTEEVFNWISGAKKAIQEIKKKLGKLQML